MIDFRQMPGLPASGPMATSFPAEWGRGGREGLVVKFREANGTAWVGNFCPGPGGLDDIRRHPNGKSVLVTTAGTLWCVDPESHTAEEMFPWVLGMWGLDESGDLLIDNQGLAFFRLGPTGVLWHSRRISWDGFQKVEFAGGRLVGEAWSVVDNDWQTFSLDPKTGQFDGGSYTGPEIEFNYPRAD